MDDSVINTRPATRDRSLSMPEIRTGKTNVGTQPTKVKSTGSNEIEVIDVGSALSSTAQALGGLSNETQGVRDLRNNFGLPNKSLGIVGKIQESFRLQDGKSLFPPQETDNVKKKWYHFYLKAPGERKLANRFTLAFANDKLEAKYLEERFQRLSKQVKALSLVLLALVLVYGLFDKYYAHYDTNILFIIRYAATAPVMALVLAIMQTRLFKRLPQVLVVFFCFVCGVQFSVCAAVSKDFALFYYQSLLWPISLGFLFLGIQAVNALGLSFMLVGTMFLGYASLAVEVLYTNQMIFQIVYFAFYAYIFEMKMRKEFLLKRVVDRERTLLKREKETSEEVLLNILPKPIAERIKSKEQVADRFAKCTVLFAKVIDIGRMETRKTSLNDEIREPANLIARTPTTNPNTITPVEVFNTLNEIFSIFDNRIALFGLEKIKTIGQSYMAVGGVPIPTENHCEQVADFAMDMREVIKQYNRKHKTAISIRIGIHSGPVVAGVIGNLKMIYDLWGDTCNVASRMESNSLPDQIQVSQTTRDLLKDKYTFENRGLFAIKGKGVMSTFFLLSKQTKSRFDFRQNMTKKPARNSQIMETASNPPPVAQEKHGDVDLLNALLSGGGFVNRFTLSFLDKKKEPSFMHVYAANAKVTVRGGLFLVLFFHIISIFAEIPVLDSSYLKLYIGFKAIAVAIYVILIVILYKGQSIYMNYMQPYALTSASVFFIYHLMAGAWIQESMYWGISSAYFFLFLFTKLRFVYAAPLGAFYYGAFKVITNLPGVNTFDPTRNVVATCLFGALVATLSVTQYYSEYLERRDFYMNLQLEKQRQKIEEEKEKADALLLNILPKSVINSLKHKKAEPEYFNEVTVLFADIVGFTDFCSNKTPAEVVHVLSGLFLRFDELVHKYNVEKIKTVGDAYTIAAGVPVPTKEHADQVACYALDMLNAVRLYNQQNNRDLKLRIGIHTGPCVAGLIGVKRFTYDIIGEAISVACHAESTGTPGRIHITEETKEKLNPHKFMFEEKKESMDTRRRGKYKTYYLLTKIEETSSPNTPL